MKIALTGVGGYANYYVNYLLDNWKKKSISIVGIIDPDPSGCNRLDELKELKIPFFENMDSFYKDNHADLMIISTPIHLHAPMTLIALKNGSNVLCEKPLCATLTDGKQMLDAANESSFQVGMGYQWSYANATQKLKKDIMKGKFGVPLRMKTLCLTPRKESYYARAAWAGKIQMPNGTKVFDSPVMNATAHDLHNMFYLLGEQQNTSINFTNIEAELYKVKPIENFDTAAFRCNTSNNVEILFYTSHSCKYLIEPLMTFDFEDATILLEGHKNARYIAKYKNGTIEDYGSLCDDPNAKIEKTISAIEQKETFLCGIQAATPHLQCIDILQKMKYHNIPDEFAQEEIFEDKNKLRYIKNIDNTFIQAYSQNLLPGELGGIPWATPVSSYK